MFVKIYGDNEMLAIQPLIIDKKRDKVKMKTLGKTIVFYLNGEVKFLGDKFDYLMCNGECYNATPDGYQEFLEEVVNKL